MPSSQKHLKWCFSKNPSSFCTSIRTSKMNPYSFNIGRRTSNNSDNQLADSKNRIRVLYYMKEIEMFSAREERRSMARRNCPMFEEFLKSKSQTYNATRDNWFHCRCAIVLGLSRLHARSSYRYTQTFPWCLAPLNFLQRSVRYLTPTEVLSAVKYIEIWPTLIFDNR